MPPEDFQNTVLSKALQRRKELEETIRNAVQEIEKIEAWLKMYSSFSTDDIESIKREPSKPAMRLSGAAYGTTQSVFETLVLSVLRDVGRPMRSPEIIEEFRRRGHPVQGNEIRTAWNRLWEAKHRGVLTSERGLGYWIAGEPLSEEAREQALVASKYRKSGVSAAIQANRGKKKGPPEAWGPEEVAAAEKMFLAGKTREEVAAALGGVSQGTIQKHFPGGVEAVLKAKYPDAVIPKRPYKPRPGHKRGGRPKTWTADQERQVLEMRAQEKSVREIIETTGIKRTTIYKIFNEHGVEVRERSNENGAPDEER